VVLAAFLAGCGALVGGGADGNGPSASGVVVLGAGGLDGQRAPAFTLVDLQGRKVSLSSYAGRPLIVNFWASWCIPCQQEFPMYRQARQQYAAQGLEVLGIVYNDTADNARRFMSRESAAWPALSDPDGSVARAYRVTAIPTTFFVDRAGIIRDASYGPPPQDALTAYITQIIQ
jgi:cytochrome c biogenesis protein CcmG, thiol:disulfide interchange protein DsbE